MQTRLTREIEEREAEAAIYNARLYATEQSQSDWYVEKRLMEAKLGKLEAEVRERDRLDAQIEACVCDLFERMRVLERTNADLQARLGGEGGVGAAAAAAAAAATAGGGASAEGAGSLAELVRAQGRGGAAAG